MQYFIIAGERSGDLHGANLYRHLKQMDPQAQARGIGGNFMEEAGVQLLKNYEDLALIGFWEILDKLGSIRKALKEVKASLIQSKPDVVILIDYAGFNLRVARFAKELGIKVFYYISPKIWAWNTGRAHKIKALVDRMFVILPFEKEFYQQFGYEVDYVGNPVLDAISEFQPNPHFLKDNNLDERPIIAILPGSRANEIESTLFRMLSILPAFPEHQFVVAGVNNFSSKYYDQFRRNGMVNIVYEQTYDLLRHAEMAIVTSGTATLETALLKVPQVVVYRVNFLSYFLGKLLIKVKFISLVNLIAAKKVVAELIQGDFIPANIRTELSKIQLGEPGRVDILKGYEEVGEKIGKPGASETAARLMVGYLKETNL
jgi:lipid-A-disaccharide synthase